MKKIPYCLFLVVLWALMRPLDGFDMAHPLGVFLVLAAFAALAIEFFKSGDIGQRFFTVDLTFALVSVIVASVATTRLLMAGGSIRLVDFLILSVVLLDAWLGPTNSFRTALRNWTGQLNQGASQGGTE